MHMRFFRLGETPQFLHRHKWAFLGVFLSLLLGSVTFLNIQKVSAAGEVYAQINAQTVAAYASESEYRNGTNVLRYYYNGSGGTACGTFVTTSLGDECFNRSNTFQTSKPAANTCSDFLRSSTPTDGSTPVFEHVTKVKDSGGACAAAEDATEINVNGTGSQYNGLTMFAQVNATTIEPVAVDQTLQFKKLEGANFGGKDWKQIYFEVSSAACPSVLIQFGDGNWGYTAPTSTGSTSAVTPYDGSETYAQAISANKDSGSYADLASKFLGRDVTNCATRKDDQGASTIDNTGSSAESIYKIYNLRASVRDLTRVQWQGEEKNGDEVGIILNLRSPNAVGSSAALKLKLAVASGTETAVVAGSKDNAGGSLTEPQCDGGALGWVICPIMEMAFTASTTVLGWFESFLKAPTPFTDTTGAVFEAWNRLRTFANILLVLAFMALVFSQSTSIGLSAYGAKKMLPKIIAAAIMINLSFFICSIGVDISNVFGSGTFAFFNSVASIGSGAGEDNIATAAESIGFGFAATGVALVGIASGAIFALLPLVVGAALALVLSIGILIFRLVLLYILIVVSPIAFALMVLPNTQGMFDKWRKLFVTMLVFYPLVMGVFGAAFATATLVGTGNAEGQELFGNDAFTGALVPLIQLVLISVPLFIMPTLFKVAGGALNRFAGIVNNKGKGVVDRTRKKSNEWGAGAKGRSASSYDGNRTGLSRLRNARGRVGTGTVLPTKRKDFLRNQIGDNYSDEQIKLASHSISSISGDKAALASKATTSKDKWEQIAIANALGDLGATKELDQLRTGTKIEYDNNPASATHGQYLAVPFSVTSAMQAAAAKSMARNGMKFKDSAPGSLAEAAVTAAGMQSGASFTDAHQKALDDGNFVQSFTDKMSAESVATLGADQWQNIGHRIQERKNHATSLMASGKTTEAAAVNASIAKLESKITTSIETASKNQNIFGRVKDEQKAAINNFLSSNSGSNVRPPSVMNDWSSITN